MQGFEEARSLDSEGVSLRTGDGSLVSAKAVGDVRLNFDSYRFILLEDVFYVLNFKRNLISVACLIKDSYSVSFSKTVVIRKNNTYVYSENLISNIYFLKPIMHALHNTELLNQTKELRLLITTRVIFCI